MKTPSNTPDAESGGASIGNGNGHINGNGNRIHNGSRHKTVGLVEISEIEQLREIDRTKRKSRIEDSIRDVLINIGEDPERDGLIRTPHRVAKAFFELLEGYEQDLETLLNNALFDVEYDDGEMIVVADIEYQSMCEHHMLPFTGKAHVAYIPRDRVVGLSKIPRIVDMFARRLQVQERLTNEIAGAITEALDPLGVMVVMSGHHSCASLRGVKKHGVNMVTTSKRGAFREDRSLQDDFYRLIDINQR